MAVTCLRTVTYDRYTSRRAGVLLLGNRTRRPKCCLHMIVPNVVPRPPALQLCATRKLLRFSNTVQQKYRFYRQVLTEDSLYREHWGYPYAVTRKHITQQTACTVQYITVATNKLVQARQPPHTSTAYSIPPPHLIRVTRSTWSMM